MRLDREAARARLVSQGHGILGTVHPERGVDLVPVVYVMHDDFVGVPIDRVKPKRSTDLRREANLRADPRASLIVDHWDPGDWSRLWWVRCQLRWVGPSQDIGADQDNSPDQDNPPDQGAGPAQGGGAGQSTGLGHSTGSGQDVQEVLARLLAAKYPQYAGQPFNRVLVLRVVDVTGWSAER